MATKSQITKLKKLNIEMENLTELEAFHLLRENKQELHFI